MYYIVKNKINLLLITLFLCSNAILAQDDPGGIGGDPGVPAPIDNWIPFMLVVGIAIVFYCAAKKTVKA